MNVNYYCPVLGSHHKKAKNQRRRVRNPNRAVLLQKTMKNNQQEHWQQDFICFYRGRRKNVKVTVKNEFFRIIFGLIILLAEAVLYHSSTLWMKIAVTSLFGRALMESA